LLVLLKLIRKLHHLVSHVWLKEKFCMGKLKHIPRNCQYISETYSKEKLAGKKKAKQNLKQTGQINRKR